MKTDEIKDFTMIPHVELSKDQKRHCCQIMIQGNRILKTLHAKAKKSAVAKKVENGDKKRYSRSEFRIELFRLLNNQAKQVTLHGVTCTAQQAKQILAVKQIENTVLAGHSKLIAKCAFRWSKAKGDGTLTVNDIYNELVTKAIHAIYSYGKEVEFSTYLVHIFNRHMMTILADDNPLSHWTNNVRKLYGKYKKAEAKATGTINFEEFVKQLDFDDDDVRELRSAMRRVIHHSELETSQEEGEALDITGLGNAAFQQEDRRNPEMTEAIANVKENLPDFEKAVLEAYISSPTGKTGWQSDVARQYTNPSTGKLYTRQCVPGVFKRVCDKIKTEYSRIINKQRVVAA